MEAAEVVRLDLSTRGRPTLGNEAVLGNEARVRVGLLVSPTLETEDA